MTLIEFQISHRKLAIILETNVSKIEVVQKLTLIKNVLIFKKMQKIQMIFDID